jgi:hypothetical protein
MLLFEFAAILLAPLYGAIKTWVWLNNRLTKLFVESRMIDEVIEGKLHWSPAGISSAILAVFIGIITIPYLFHMFPILLFAGGVVYIFWLYLGIKALVKTGAHQRLLKLFKNQD